MASEQMIKRGYQEFICGDQGRDSTLDNAMSQYEAFGLLPAEAAAEVASVIEVVNTWREHFVQAGVSASDVESLAERIDGEQLLTQRGGFEREKFQAPLGKRKKPGPFQRS